ncbi:MAG: hypothetical protein JSR44_08350 [Spirochaetes bacterium]|nr:hypothetical protein [Spirochaetota bacterium]
MRVIYWPTVANGYIFEVVVIYDFAYFIAWWMAMIRIRSLQKISQDQAQLYERRVSEQRVRLARNVHDSLGSDLLQLSEMTANLDGQGDLRRLVDEIILKTRGLVQSLDSRQESGDFIYFIRSSVEPR